MISNGRRKHSPLSNLDDEKTSAKVASVVERASRAVGPQPAASSAKSIRRMGGGQCFRGEKMTRVGCDRVGVEVQGGARPGDRVDHVEVLEGGGSVRSDQVPRDKLSPGQAVESD